MLAGSTCGAAAQVGSNCSRKLFSELVLVVKSIQAADVLGASSGRSSASHDYMIMALSHVGGGSMSDVVLPSSPVMGICEKCKRTVFIITVPGPAPFKSDCEDANCPINAQHKPEPLGEFKDPPDFAVWVEFAEEEET